jgi:hypothetical protein
MVDRAAEPDYRNHVEVDTERASTSWATGGRSIADALGVSIRESTWQHDSMDMSQEHKDALAKGRREARDIKAFLKAIEPRRGRPVTRETLGKRLERVNQRIEASDDPLKTVELIQSRIDIETALAKTDEAPDLDALEARFVESARSYSDRRGITYTAWREFGVPAATLKAAGIPETRRR